MPVSSEGFDGRTFSTTLPTAPGVYRMLDAGQRVLYVGKAKNLRKRVGTYFARPQLEARIQLMVQSIASVVFTITRTESEALVLENELIKSLKPRFNILLRDDKSYPFIHFSAAEFPRLAFHRGARGKGRYFGPFPSTVAVREAIDRLQKLFRLRSCEDTVFRHRTRPCLQHQIQRCSAPCVGLISPEQYAEDLRRAEWFLSGRSHELIDELIRNMEAASQALAFEQAAELRDAIARLRSVQARQMVSGQEQDSDVVAASVVDRRAAVFVMFFREGLNLGSRTWQFPVPEGSAPAGVLEAFLDQHYAGLPPPRNILLSHALDLPEEMASVLSERAGRRIELLVPKRGARVELRRLAMRNAQNALLDAAHSEAAQQQRWLKMLALLELPEDSQRIECFDISHTQGELTVASCVALGPTGPIRSAYRRFNIKDVTAGDDYAAIAQAVRRRVQRMQTGEFDMPAALLIDGGSGQVGAARRALEELEVALLPVLGISKGPDRKAGFEQIILANGRVLRPDDQDPGLHQLQVIRDEAHRFAITAHRKKREKAREQSLLEEIEGVGKLRRQILLKQFGGMQGLLAAGVAELAAVRGIDRTLAERIYAHLHP
ncbi:MAG: excinuclease ABC subunit UvrC [Ahniella sp.]|nr:excinuclease ABC subunit UvrC [Ahniella sp.]